MGERKRLYGTAWKGAPRPIRAAQSSMAGGAWVFLRFCERASCRLAYVFACFLNSASSSRLFFVILALQDVTGQLTLAGLLVEEEEEEEARKS